MHRAATPTLNNCLICPVPASPQRVPSARGVSQPDCKELNLMDLIAGRAKAIQGNGKKPDPGKETLEAACVAQASHAWKGPPRRGIKFSL